MVWGRAAFCVGALWATASLPADAREARTWYGEVALNANETDFSGVITATSVCGTLGISPCPVVGEELTRSTATGYGASATLGKKFGMFRLEAEVGYSKSDATQYAELTQASAMLNGLLDVPVTDSITLSLGGGIGVDIASWDHKSTDADDSSLAYQGIVGIGIALTDTIDLTLDYRYMSVPDLGLDVRLQYNSTTTVNVAVDELDTQSVSVGIRFAL